MSIRKVAERAGYAYTTVYQYYQGLDELLQATKRVMVGEFLADLKGGRTEREALPADIRRFCRAHAAYFVERPNVYELLYAYRLGDGSIERLAGRISNASGRRLTAVYHKAWQFSYRKPRHLPRRSSTWYRGSCRSTFPTMVCRLKHFIVSWMKPSTIC